jgi:hypothetical protein
VQEYVGRTVPFPLHRDSLLLHVHCLRASLCIREFNVSDSLKACLEMMLFVDISGETAVLVMNLSNCGWSEDPTNGVTP